MLGVGPAVLIVEDEPAIAESLQYALERAGFATEIAITLRAARQLLAWPRLVVLDLMLPDGDGLDLIRCMRNSGNSTPIIVLSSRGDEMDRVSALEQGADDYVTKPFSPREIVARIRANLRRFDPTPAEESVALWLDPNTRTARTPGGSVELTRVEFDLLQCLLADPGRAFTRPELIDSVWGEGFAITDRTVDSHVKALRKKLSEAGNSAPFIHTVRGVGFRVELDA